MPVSRSACSATLKLQVAPVNMFILVYHLPFVHMYDYFYFKKKGFDFLESNLEPSGSLF